jgi:pimeloyl-ACP methyl ester carboxylesterase
LREIPGGRIRRESLSPDEPVLIFIHGTASSARGSFGALWSPDNDSGKAVRIVLRKQYGDRVFAFQHWSLTKSPVQNALELVDKLPKGARKLHLVSHSRGGLIGELLSLSGLKKGELTRELIDKLYVSDRTTVPARRRSAE